MNILDFTMTLAWNFHQCVSGDRRTVTGLAISCGSETTVTHTPVSSRQVLAEGMFSTHRFISTLVNIWPRETSWVKLSMSVCSFVWDTHPYSYHSVWPGSPAHRKSGIGTNQLCSHTAVTHKLTQRMRRTHQHLGEGEGEGEGGRGRGVMSKV